MQYFRALSVVLFVLSLGSICLASPTGSDIIVKRDNADIKTVFDALKAKTDSILPQITTLTSAGNATSDSITPLLTDLTSALTDAKTSLAGLSPSALSKRQSDDELAALVAGIINDIVAALQTLVGDLSTIPLLAGLLAGVDSALNEVLLGLGILLKGVLTLVADLLRNVAGLLTDLSFDLTLGTLGL